MDLCLEIGVTRHALSRLERVLGTYPENKEIDNSRATTFLTTYFYGKKTAKASFYILPY